MWGKDARSGGSRLLRPIVRAADGLAHNRERRRMINRYRRVTCVALVACDEESLGLPARR